MTTTLRLILFILILYMPAMLSASESPWDQTIDTFAKDISVPSKITVQTKVKKTSGDIIESSLLHSNLRKTAEGDILFLVADGMMNNKQIPDKDLMAMTETVEEKELQPTLHFFSTLRAEFDWEATNVCQEIDNRKGCSYSFSGKIEDRNCAGFIWLDELTQLPLMVVRHITDVPFEEDDSLIRSLHQKDMYRINEKGRCYLHTSSTRISAQYYFLFMKKDIEIETIQTYHEYRNRQMLLTTN